MKAEELPDKQRQLIFWASFLSLMAAGFGFSYRVMNMGTWASNYDLTGQQAGAIFGASLWPIAITMILFSLIVDKVGHKLSMYIACVLQILSVVLSIVAGDAKLATVAAICAGLGHGVVEAVINPVCATMFPKNKTKMLNILHAAWPAGLVVGGSLVLITQARGGSDTLEPAYMLIPVLAFGLLLLPCKFPTDERVQNKVPYSEMLKEIGFATAFLAFFLLSYTLVKEVGGLFGKTIADTTLLIIGIVVGLAVGALFFVKTKSFGKPLYFILCLLMIPLATTELGTDAWIKELMEPTMGELAGWALVLSALIMMGLRFQAGILTKRFSPPTILIISSFFSLCGLMALSVANGFGFIFLAFALYAVGQTFYWPTVLGLASERYPRGGALTINTVSAIGLLAVGIIGSPIIGSFRGSYTAENVKALSSEVYDAGKTESSFFAYKYDDIKIEDASTKATELGLDKKFGKATSGATRKALRTVAIVFPGVMLVSFALIALFFRATGGYKPIELGSTETSGDNA